MEWSSSGIYTKFLWDQVVPDTPDKGKKAYPIKAELIKQTWFEKLDEKHSCIAEKVFETAVIHIFKSRYLTKPEQVVVGKCRVDIDILWKLIPWAKGVNFSSLQDSNDGYRKQS